MKTRMKTPLHMIHGFGRVLMFLGASAAVAFGQTTTTTTTTTTDAKAKDKDNLATDSGIVTLSPFTVQDSKDYGWRKTTTTTTSRVAIPVIKNPQAIEILSGELLSDMNIALPKQVFRYSSDILVGETEIGQAGLYTMRSFQLPIFYNGLTLASSFSLTPIIPVDNLDRVEIAKGPVALYYTNSTPNGVANFVTKKPEFINSSSYKFTVGSYNFYKGLIDTQYVISKEKGMAMRLISSYQDWNGRVDYQHASLLFIDPSFAWRPNDKIDFTIEYNDTIQKSPYATFYWGLAQNPQYRTDVTNPSAALLTYMQNAYGLADATAARAKIQERWGYPANGTIVNSPPNPGTTQGSIAGTFMANWSNDIMGMTGTAPALYTGSTIDWWRYSPRGDRVAQAGPDSNFDGDAQMADAALTFTPTKDLSVRYHWLHMVNNTAFTRQLYTPDAGFRSDGRIIAMNWAGALSWTPHRYGTSDAQQIDAQYTLEGWNMKHNFNLGYELDHTKATIDNVTTDLSKGGTGVDANGNVLSGAQSYFYYDPFGSSLNQGIYKVVASGPVQTNYSLANFSAITVSYRGEMFNDRLNVVVGMRRSKLINTGRKDDSPTYGAIWQVTKGIHVFASASKMVTFTNQLSVIGPGTLPSDNAHLLDNEHDKGTEFGVKTDWADNKLSGTISVYSDERSGYIQLDFAKSIADPRNTGSNITVTQAQPYINGGVQRAEGIEGDLTWTPNRNWQMTVNGAYQYTAKQVSDVTLDPRTPGDLAHQTFNRRLIKSPKYRANIMGKYNFTGDLFHNMSIGGAVRYTDDYYVTASPQYWIIVPHETIIDMFATYTTKSFGVPTDYQLNLINLTNQINDITRSNGLEIRGTVGFRF